MNNTFKSLALSLAAGLAGAAFFTLSNARFLASAPADVLLAITISIGLLALAASDYSRRLHPLKVQGRILRPTQPARNSAKAIEHDRLAA